jgi:hypothetical protein
MTTLGDYGSQMIATKCISQRYMFFFKWIRPVSFVAIFATVFAIVGQAFWVPLVFFVLVACLPTPILGSLMPVIGKPIWMFADEVRDGGDFLWVRRGKVDDRIPLADIVGVSFLRLVAPAQLTLTLREPCKFGSRVVFSPPTSSIWNPFAKNAVVESLRQRIDRAGSGHR